MVYHFRFCTEKSQLLFQRNGLSWFLYLCFFPDYLKVKAIQVKGEMTTENATVSFDIVKIMFLVRFGHVSWFILAFPSAGR